MPPWILKAAVQGVIAQLPNPQRWNLLFQRYVTRSLGLDDAMFDHKWRQCRGHMEHFAELAPGRAPTRVLELGTGWYPLVPIGLTLLGAERVYTVDQQSLLTVGRVREAIVGYLARIDDGRVDGAPPAGVDRLRAAAAAGGELGLAELLSRVGVTAIVGDACALSLDPGSIDLFVSNNTFEHIPRDVLAAILREFRRLAAPGAVGSHYVDMRDHYVAFDRSISVYNYLKYPSWMWKWFNTGLHHQNRLRLPDYRQVHDETGWPVAREIHSRGDLAALRAIRVSPEFARYTEAELLVPACWMLSRAG